MAHWTTEYGLEAYDSIEEAFAAREVAVRKDERAKIVAWLRTGLGVTATIACRPIADLIEAGHHEKQRGTR